MNRLSVAFLAGAFSVISSGVGMAIRSRKSEREARKTVKSKKK
jgi:hypothetical protein